MIWLRLELLDGKWVIEEWGMVGRPVSYFCTNVATALAKRGRKTLLEIAMTTDKDLFGNIVVGKNAKEAALAGGREALSAAKNKALELVEQFCILLYYTGITHFRLKSGASFCK